MKTTVNHREFINPLVNPNEPVSMSACGSGYCQPYFYFYSGIRQEHTLHYVLDGNGWYEVNNTRYQIKKGDIFAIFPDTLFTLSVDKNNPWLFCWVNFYGQKATEYCKKAGISIETPVIHHINDVFPNVIEECLEHVTKNDSYYSQFQLSACVYQCLAEIDAFTNHISPQVPSRSLYVSTAIAYMEQYYWKTLRISSLAKYLGIEKSYFYRIFKKETGCSPVEYLIDLRIEKAKNLIRHGYSFQEIASSIGINDLFYFSKLFTKKTGYTPSKYRELFR